MPEARKIAIVGAGPGGYVAALRGAQLGAKVTVIEDREVGGTCLNRGCIPSKAIISCVDVLDKIKKSEEFGIKISGEVTPDLSRIIDRKNRIVGTLIKGIHSLFKSWGVELIEGRGSLADQHQVQVVTKGGEERTVSADSIILATGSRPARIPMFPFDGKWLMSSDDVLDM
ncbi:MAG: FAD-dependent oxidoreductase [Nitrospirota bacterium]